MKIRSIYALATILALAATIGAQSASAQSVDLRSNVPFEFYAGGKLFPAGTYLVSKVNPTTLRLRDSRGKAIFISAGRETVGMNDGSWLVFNQYGDRSFFAGAYWSGSGNSLRIPASQAEREVAKTASQPSPIRIAAK